MGDEWITYRDDWYNDRIMETFISAPIIDKQNDLIPTKTMEESMDFFMKYGVYSFKHEEQPIGLPLAWKTEDGKVKIKVGIHSGLEMHDHAWKEIKAYGLRGGSSIRGEATQQKQVCEGDKCHNQIDELGLWSVSWVEDHPANPQAEVTQVAAMAKSDLKKETVSVKAPDGYHWMNYKEGPVLMEGEYQPHDGASAEFEFEVITDHDPELLKGCGCGCSGSKSETTDSFKYNNDNLRSKEGNPMTEETANTEVASPEEISEEKAEEVTEEVKEEETTEEVKEEHEEEKEEEDEKMEDEKMDHKEEKADYKKNMENVKTALMAALDYLSDEKMDHEEDKDMHEEDKDMHEEKAEDPAKEKEINLDEAIKALKKNGYNVYSGSKTTPAPKKINTPKSTYSLEDLVKRDWDELERIERGM